jgi:hypothetical protein
VSFLDYLLAGDTDGSLHAIVEADQQDLAAGITWGLFDGDRLIDMHPARYMAEASRHDCADGADRPVTDYRIAEMCQRCKAVEAGSACCEAHGKHLCHSCYRATHFVEVCVPGSQVYRDAWHAEVVARNDGPITHLSQDEMDRIADVAMGPGFKAAVESAYRAGQRSRTPGLEVVCLCGPSRFQAELAEATRVFTGQGVIVLSTVELHPDGSVTAEEMATLVRVHNAKIRFAGRVMVVTDGSGYFGEHTKSEIELAVSLGKPVGFIHPAAEERYQRKT